MNSKHNAIQRARRAGVPATILVILLATFVTGSALAVENPWMIGIDGVGNNIGEDDDLVSPLVDEEGDGGALQVGYLFSPNFQVRFYGSGATHKTDNPDVEILFSGALIEVVYLFNAGQRFRPYVFGGLGGFVAESQQGGFTYETEGSGASFGGGLHYFLNSYVSVHSSARFEAVNWETLRVTLDTGVGTIGAVAPAEASGGAAKFTLGLGFWF